MKDLKKCITIYAVTLLFAGLLFGPRGLSAAEPSGLAGRAIPIERVELTAPIMEINLVDDFMVVAEKKIQLLSTMKDGVKVWITVFQDDNGNRISFNNFRQRDRVCIKGVRVGLGGINAHEITLLPHKRVILPSQQPVPSPLK